METHFQKRVIEIVDYDPKWQTLFLNEKEKLASALGKNIVRVEHMGSTSVSGLPAKPIIDILIEVHSIKDVDLSSSKMEVLEYLVKGENGIPGRRYFQKGGNQRSHQVHVYQKGDANLVRHRAFKEYLKAHAEIANRYAIVKRAAVHNCNNDIYQYMALKNDFIAEHEPLALAWYEKLV